MIIGHHKVDGLFLIDRSSIKKTIVRMVCSICNGQHTATRCNSDTLQQSVARIKAYWLGENMPEGWTDELVKNWVTTDRRIGRPYWRRIWRMLHVEWHSRQWWRIPQAEVDANRVLSFYSPEPRTVHEFKRRIRGYERPAELPDAPPRPAPRPVPPRPVPRPRVPAEAAGGVMAPLNGLNVDAEVRLLRRHMEDALVMHRRRMNRQLQEQQKQINRKIGLVMDTPDEANFFDPVCAICMDGVTQDTVLAFGCKHTFCGNCAIETIKKTNFGCPTCRANISEIHFKPSTDRETFNKLSTHLSFS